MYIHMYMIHVHIYTYMLYVCIVMFMYECVMCKNCGFQFEVNHNFYTYMNVLVCHIVS